MPLKERIKKLDSIMQRLCEDNIDGKISDDRFSRMSATYETEQKQLEARVSELGRPLRRLGSNA